ncbi:hypothetical protein LIA77_03428 [Sarocladium implicatum]|nr:hypothetical protein LIA77_03428 [Sarocladium implicatum]
MRRPEQFSVPRCAGCARQHWLLLSGMQLAATASFASHAETRLHIVWRERGHGRGLACLLVLECRKAALLQVGRLETETSQSSCILRDATSHGACYSTSMEYIALCCPKSPIRCRKSQAKKRRLPPALTPNTGSPTKISHTPKPQTRQKKHPQPSWPLSALAPSPASLYPGPRW